MALLDGDPEGGNPQTHSERTSALPCHHVAIRSWAGPFSLGLGSSTSKMQEEVVLKVISSSEVMKEVRQERLWRCRE